jgi:hypothetical protein
VREIRDEVERRVEDLIVARLDEIRSDRTAHQLRLVRLLPDLVREFEGRRTPEEIRACADAILSGYEEAPVRSFVMSIVNKRARECLRKERCDVLAVA